MTPVTSPEAPLSAFLRMTARACGVSLSGLIRLSGPHARLLASHPGGHLPDASPPLFLMPTGETPVWICDALARAELVHEPWVTGAPGMRYCAAVSVPGQPGLALFVADGQPRGATAGADLEALGDCARLVDALLRPPEPWADAQNALHTHAEHLRRDLAVAQATLGVYALSELDLEPGELMQEAMRLVGAHGELDWCGVVALQDERARLTGAWHAPGAAAYAHTLQTSFPREGHDWLWRAGAQPGPMTLEHLPPSLRETPLLAPVRGLFTLPLGTHDAVPYLLVGLQLVGLQLSERGGRGRDLPLMQAVARVIRQTLDRQAQAELLATRHAELQYTLDHAPLILWRTDERGIFQAGQGQGLQPLGLSSASLLGRSALEVYGGAPEVVSSLRRGLAGEAHLGHSSVAGRAYETHFQPLWSEGGEQTGLLGLSYDVTERAQAQRHFEVLFRLSTLLEGLRELSAVAPEVLATLGTALDVDWLVLWRQDGDTLYPLALHGDAPQRARIMQERGLPLARYLAMRHPDGRPLELTHEAMPPEAQGAGLGWAVLAPVCDQPAQRHLVLGAYRRAQGSCSVPQLILLESAARVLRSAAVREHHLQTLQTHAFSDSLTGLGNRRAFHSDLERGLSQALRHGSPYSVLSLDVDGLKAINDRLGHPAGDRLLATLGRELRVALRQEDRLYRLGGDEFVALLPHLGPDHPLSLQHRLERALAATRAAGFPGVGLSRGLATAPQDGSDAASLLRLSDERLYADKASKAER